MRLRAYVISGGKACARCHGQRVDRQIELVRSKRVELLPCC